MDYVKRPYRREPVSTERIIEKVVEKKIEPVQQPIDVNALANALAQIIKTMPISSGQMVINTEDAVFDNTKTLERLANSMTVQRGKSESNFDNLGNEHQTKRDKEETAKTIDLLSNLSD